VRRSGVNAALLWLRLRRAALYRDRTASLPSLPPGLVMPGQPEGKDQAKNNDDDDIHWIQHYALAARP